MSQIMRDAIEHGVSIKNELVLQQEDFIIASVSRNINIEGFFKFIILSYTIVISVFVCRPCNQKMHQCYFSLVMNVPSDILMSVLRTSSRSNFGLIHSISQVCISNRQINVRSPGFSISLTCLLTSLLSTSGCESSQDTQSTSNPCSC